MRSCQTTSLRIYLLAGRSASFPQVHLEPAYASITLKSPHNLCNNPIIICNYINYKLLAGRMYYSHLPTDTHHWNHPLEKTDLPPGQFYGIHLFIQLIINKLL